MASAHRAEKDNFIGDLLWARRLLSRSAKGALKLHKIEFLDWLASPEGPQPSRSLKAIETSARTWVLIWARRALLGQFSFPLPRRRLYVPASQNVKVIALRRFARQYKLQHFVETGTYLGDTTAALAPMFSRCFTIEIAPTLYQRSRDRLKAFANVQCVLGDSAAMLPEIVSQLNGSALFWLDGHASGGETFNSGKGPLMTELDAIYSDQTTRHVTLIDDARGHDLEAIRCFCAGRLRVDVRNDIVRIVPIK